MEQNAGPDTHLSTDATAAFYPSLSQNPLTVCQAKLYRLLWFATTRSKYQGFGISVLVGQALSQLGS